MANTRSSKKRRSSRIGARALFESSAFLSFKKRQNKVTPTKKACSVAGKDLRVLKSPQAGAKLRRCKTDSAKR